MMKIDGNRIEPAEIEIAIKKLTGLEDVMVRGIQDKSRAFVAAYFIENEAADRGLLDGNKLIIDRDELYKRLPYYMIPTYYIAVKEFPKNANGKFVRKQLPVPDITKYFAEYAAPENELQKKICTEFERVLGITGVGINDDFYAVGGDSLATLTLLSRLGVSGLSAMDIFVCRTPGKISAVIESEYAAEGLSLSGQEEIARGREYPLTAFQLNMFDYQLCAPKSCMWNIPMLFSVSLRETDAPRFIEAAKRMAEHHPVFRTTIRFDEDGRVVQSFDPAVDLPIKVENVSEEEFERIKPVLNRPIEMLHSPLISVRIFVTETNIYMFLFSHHMVVDGSGINIMLNTLWNYYDGEETPPVDTWYTYLDEEQKNTYRKRYEQAAQYFRQEFEDIKWCDNLKPDHTSNDMKYKVVVLQSDLTAERLKKIKASTGLSPNELCAAISLLAMAESEGEENVMLNWVFQNRMSPESENAAGLTIRLLPVGASFTGDEDITAFLHQVSARIRDGIANSSNDWCLDNESVFQNDALFLVYEASIMDMESMSKRNAVVEILPNPDSTAVRRTALQVLAAPAGLVFRFIYVSSLYEDAHITAFTRSLEKWIKKL